MPTCYSKLFAERQFFTYDLAELGRYYRHYQNVMAHWHQVLPAERILDVRYEDVVSNTEEQTRRLLDYCGLPWNEQCLRFHENDRAVRTASSEQVRRPIFREGLDQWRQYEPWLGPLKEALGDVATRYPNPP